MFKAVFLVTQNEYKRENNQKITRLNKKIIQ